MATKKKLFKIFTKIFAVSLFLAAPLVARTIDGVIIPDTPAGKVFADFLTAFNSGDIEELRSFHAGHGGDPGKAGQDINLYNQSGELELQSVIGSSDYEIVALVQARKTGEWLEFTMGIGSTAPYPVERLRVRPVPTPERAPNRKGLESSEITGNLTNAEMTSLLEAYLNGLVREDKFSGVVLIAKEDRAVFEKACGFADKERKIENNIETKFNIGSMNKMFTAVSVAQLAEEGKLSFEDKVGKYLPDYPNKQVADNVTIHQLLTHTSGLGSYWNERFNERKSGIRTVADYLALFADEPLLFEPGQRYEYSNSGYIVLGAIIEKVSGRDYFDYVCEHIYRPAGMKDTDAYESSREIPNLAMGYTNAGPDGRFSGGPRMENTSTRPNRGGPAGGGYSTAWDLVRFSIALRSHRLLSSSYTETVTSGKVEGGPGRYGYGFGEEITNGRRIFGHSGGAPGIAANMSIFPESGYTAVVLMNYDPQLMTPVVRKVRELILSLKES